ncbi:MAG TPA: SAM-dependent methyltransferase [Pseudonocardiaceae bacterium]
MTESITWIPDGVDQELPSSARIYDYLLGGAHNFAADRQIAERFAAVLPGSREIARLNRAFLRRAVLFMVSSGVRQFLDLGSGIPTVGNVHEIAQRAAPESRVVYVDNEPVAVSHSALLLEGNPGAAAVQADLTEPDAVLRHRETRRLIDFSRPLGLLAVGVLHFVPDSRDPDALLGRYRAVLAPGSLVALSHFTADTRPAEVAAMVEVMRHTKDPVHPRSRERFTEFFAGLELVEPGVVSTALWRPDSAADLADRPERDQIHAGVGRVPGAVPPR